MSIFDRFHRLNNPGPALPKNLPRKKGIFRFFELLSRDFSKIFLMSMLQSVLFLPIHFLYYIAMMLLVQGSGVFFFVSFAAIALYGIALGPLQTANYFVISKSLLDAPEFWWQDWKKTFKGSFRQTAAAGVFYSLVLGLHLAMVDFLPVFSSSMMTIGTVISALITYMILPYFFLQAGYLTLSPLPLVRNSVLLALSNLLRSLPCGFAFLAGYAILAFYPGYFIAFAFLGMGLVLLLQTQLIWPAVDKAFGIEAEYYRRNAETIEGVEKIDFHDPEARA